MSEPDNEEEEQAPENLRRKWVEREYFGKETVCCPSCKKMVRSESLTCIFCGATVNQDTGFLGRILYWFKQFFS